MLQLDGRQICLKFNPEKSLGSAKSESVLHMIWNKVFNNGPVKFVADSF